MSSEFRQPKHPAMPAAPRLNAQEKEKLKIAYAGGIGLRDLARRSGVNENTLCSIARREKWTQTIESAKSIPRTDAPCAPDVAGVVAQSHDDEMKSASRQTKSALARGLLKGAKHVETLEGVSVLASAREISSLAGAASKVHEWERGERELGGVNIAISISREDIMRAQVVEME